ncbi:DUF6165 family protein [Thermoproteota archaeon]
MPPTFQKGEITIKIAPGELLDKITILQIKTERISDSEKLKNVKIELDILNQAKHDHIPESQEITDLETQLKHINETLWDIEDNCRECERHNQFNDRFIDLTRSVYKTNDKRAAIKKQINLLLKSDIIEEKSYARY